MAELKTVGRELSRALDAVAEALQNYFTAAQAEGREAPEGPTARGLDDRQLRRKIACYVTAKLSPKPLFGQPPPVLTLEGAPEARRYVAAHPLPGLS